MGGNNGRLKQILHKGHWATYSLGLRVWFTLLKLTKNRKLRLLLCCQRHLSEVVINVNNALYATS